MDVGVERSDMLMLGSVQRIMRRIHMGEQPPVEIQPSVRGDTGTETYRDSICGIVHCPVCGDSLWPPERLDEAIVTESGVEIASPLEANPGEKVYHRDCYAMKLNREEEPMD